MSVLIWWASFVTVVTKLSGALTLSRLKKPGFGNAETYRQAKAVRSLHPVAVAASAA